MKKGIPKPTLQRLIKLESVLSFMNSSGEEITSSSKLSMLMGVEANTIRKDLSYLKEVGEIGAGYHISKLLKNIRQNLKIEEKKSGCLVGIGKLGNSIIHLLENGQFPLVLKAAFDKNINRIETLRTPIPLYPAYEMDEVISRHNIEVAILAIPGNEVPPVLDVLIKNKIKGIINYSEFYIGDNKEIGMTAINLNINQQTKYLYSLLNL